MIANPWRRDKSDGRNRRPGRSLRGSVDRSSDGGENPSASHGRGEVTEIFDVLNATDWGVAGLCAACLVVAAAESAWAGRYQLAAAGEISTNASSDVTIPVGTPWSLELTYDTAAPDLDFEVLGAADPTYGRFKNTAAPPALVSFHYRAGSYEVTLDDPADFGDVRARC